MEKTQIVFSVLLGLSYYSPILPPYSIKTDFGNHEVSEKVCIIDFFTIAISVILSDRSLHSEGQKKIREKLPPVGIETRANALPTELGLRSVGQEISEVSLVCFMHHFTC